ncbi:MAG: DUF2784 domain-containing protein [Actinomycetota bacterium]|nr:DUF2784 domain-containing protein [Actinomycetota bacterium]
MVFRFMADLVVVVHFAFLVFVAAGALLAWRWPRLALLHVPAVAWALGSITAGLPCPLTSLEKGLRELGGDEAYPGGFVDRYLEGVVYPEALTPLLWVVAAVAIAVGYAALLGQRTAGPAS